MTPAPTNPATSPKTFLDRDNWMRAVLASGLRPIIRLVAVRIALHLRVNSGKCDPGYAALARELHISERSVIRMVATLERTGWLAVVRNGWHRVNHFILLWGDKIVSPLRDDEIMSPQQPSGVTNSSVRGDRALSHRGVTHAVTHMNRSKRAKRKAGEESDSGPLHFAGSKRKESPSKKRFKAANLDGEFEGFWAAYPRRVAKEAARKAFAKAIENGADAETLMAGAKRYAIERNGEPPRYTKHPATWLNAGCWQDEMPAGAVIDQTGAIVAIEQPPPQQQARQRGIVALGEELAQWIEANGNKWIGEF